MNPDDDLEVIEIASPRGVEVIEVDAGGATLDDVEIIAIGAPARAAGGAPGVRRFRQTTPVARWVVPHDLARHAVPLALYDATGALRSEWNVTHPEINRMVIDFDVPTAGALDYL